MELVDVVRDLADALVSIDSSRVPFRTYAPGVGPYGEPQLLKLATGLLNAKPGYAGIARTKRAPDLLVEGHWALECKIVRPYGDNDQVAENWSANLVHPYEGSTSLLGDCLKLQKHGGAERRAALVIGYEHTPPLIELEPLLRAFELLARELLAIRLGPRVQTARHDLVHPVHQQLIVAAWEVQPSSSSEAE